MKFEKSILSPSEIAVSVTKTLRDENEFENKNKEASEGKEGSSYHAQSCI